MSQDHLFRDVFQEALLERLFVCDALNPADLERHGTSIATAPLAPAESAQRELNRSEPVLDVAQTRHHRIKTTTGVFRVSGNSILCECPDCHAPMTVRTWLKLADCWRCPASIQLTREQLEQIADLTVPTSPPPSTPRGHLLPEPRKPVRTRTSDPAMDRSTDPRHEEFQRLTRQGLVAGILRRGISAVPAWLLSFVLHLILILLLALLVFQNSVPPETITLSTFTGSERRLGGEIRIENPDHTMADDLLMASEMEVDREELRDVVQQAKQDAKELLRDEAPLAVMPDLDDVKKNVTTERGHMMSFAARDPRVRSEIVTKEGGTSLTEAAVARGLRWLASVQNVDGSWSLAHYDRSQQKNNQGDAAATSLALLPFLGAGQTHEFGIYRETVARGLAWLIRNQKPDGDLRINFPGQAGMYAHGQGTIVLCEALAMTGDQKFREPAQKAIAFIENAQHGAGGWRYNPGQAGDTSMLGWQLMALQSARAGNLGIDVNQSTLKLADYYLDQAIYRQQRGGEGPRNMPAGSLYTYRPGEGNATAAMTAEAMLCRMYLGWKKDDPRMIEAIRWLIENHLPDERERNIYYWYYATQVMHNFGGEVWDVWNRRMRAILIAGQEKKGTHAGSWSPRDYEWGNQGGRIYVTSLSVCSLEVYYRHLPLFEQIDLGDASTVSHNTRRQ